MRALFTRRLGGGVLVALLLGSVSVGCSCSVGKKPESASSASAKKKPRKDAGKDAAAAPEDGAKDAAALDASKTAAATPEQKGREEPKPEEKNAAPAPAPAPAAPERPEMNGKAEKAFRAGSRAFSTGDLAGARRQYQDAIKADDDAIEAYYSLGVVQERLGSARDAQKSYQKALVLAPDYEPALAALALLLARDGKRDEASRMLEAAAPKVKDRAVVLTALAEVKSLGGESGEAQRLAQEALKANPNYAPAMVALARDHYRARRIDLALYALAGILDGYGEENPPRDKKNADAHLLRGIIYRERGLRGPSMEELEAALAERPDLVEARMVLANYMLESGNAKGAVPHLEQAVRYDGSNVPAHLLLGDAYRLLDRPAESQKELEWVLKADPKQVAAHYNLGLLFLLSDKLPGLTPGAAVDRALRHLEAYKAQAPRGGPDDVDELITRAKTKKALLEAEQGGAKAKEGGADS
jgi:Tfp pilus assembly protein PilF